MLKGKPLFSANKYPSNTKSIINIFKWMCNKTKYDVQLKRSQFSCRSGLVDEIVPRPLARGEGSAELSDRRPVSRGPHASNQRPVPRSSHVGLQGLREASVSCVPTAALNGSMWRIENRHFGSGSQHSRGGRSSCTPSLYLSFMWMERSYPEQRLSVSMSCFRLVLTAIFLSLLFRFPPTPPPGCIPYKWKRCCEF